MKKFVKVGWALLLFWTAGCSSDSVDEPVVTTPLGTPQVTVAQSGEQVTLRWSAVENAAQYGWELQQVDGMLKSGTTRLTSYTFEMEAGASYQFRVQAQPRSGAPYQPSAWSAVATVSSQKEPEPGEEPGEDPGEEPDPKPTPELNEKIGLPLAGEADGVIRAFPGAEGGGMYTTGGRGGEIYHVTNLNDSGAGSLRDAVSCPNRTIVFDVCGTIALKSTLRIKSSNLTIAGQTAPGDGICIKDYTVQIDGDNIIIRYLRFRLGDLTATAKSPQEDCIWGRYHRDIILDHCSMSWSIDESASFYANQNFTMQWCLIGEALRASGHPKGNHGYGGIWGGKNASFHHNMLIHNDSRNCRIDHPQVYGDYVSTHRGNVDYRNNVVYNWGSNSTYGGEDGWFNMVANYYKPGPASSDRKYFVQAEAYYEKDGAVYATKYPELYMEGNVHTKHSDISADNQQGVKWNDGSSYTNYQTFLSVPLAIQKDDQTTCYTTTHTAETAFERVADYAGASLCRDAVDSRLSEEAKTGTATYKDGGNGSKNGIIDTQTAVGGWPQLSATEEQIARAATDTDGDGIPDYYEQELGLDASDASDATLRTLDPQHLYSNLEVYLHYLVREITAAQVVDGAYTALN